MRKLTKTAVVVASMAVMAMDATVMTSAATEGWVQSGSNWYYYVDGEKVSDQWVLAGDNWYFVDEEGRMVRNTFVRIDKYDGSSEVLDDNDIHASLGTDDIDDDSEFYYMNADGTMHKGWKEFKASNIYASPNSDKASTVWYYFGATGRMYVNEWLESNGEWYALSNNGQMYAEAVVNNDLIDWDDDNYYYMKKDGAWAKGWYQTTKSYAGSAPGAACKEDEEDGDETNRVFIKDEKKWVYGDPNTGVLAQREWKEINGKYYFFGVAADTDDKEDSLLLLQTNLTTADDEDLNLERIEMAGGFVATGSAAASYIRPENKDDEDIQTLLGIDTKNAKEKTAMYSDVFVRWRNHKGYYEYFYLKKDGDALTTWKELDDDYWICGNSKGELYYDEVALINGKYYYFDEHGICDEKYLNNTVDYVAVIDPENKYKYEDGRKDPDRKKDVDNSWHISSGALAKVMYETTSDRNVYHKGYSLNGEDEVYKGQKLSIAEMRTDLATYEENGEEKVNLTKVYYRIDSRRVNVKSMTDNEVILAYTAKHYNDSLTDNAYNREITVYKLRTSGKLTGKVSAPTISQ